MPRTGQASPRWASSPTGADPKAGSGEQTETLAKLSRRVRETANILFVLASTPWLDREIRDRSRSIRADLLELIDGLERRVAREKIESEPACKTDRLLADVAAAPVTAGPTNEATTDALEGGGR